MARICVFCGSSTGVSTGYSAAAADMGRALVRRGLGLVYGGGSVGIMGVLADTVMAEGGEVIGVIPKDLLAREIGKLDITDLRVVESMHQRKQLMSDLSDGFIALPGGMGTFEELCEVLTWAQLDIHDKPVGLVNASDYYRPLLALFDHAVTEGFVAPTHRMLLQSAATPDELLDAFGF
ncbi:MAG: TIGR00730 family Rossman fold protein [Actinomycetota bacterium]|nr:TIGR00730 family Rossman fold protein [Actinomycetota bacterium]